MQIHMLFKDVDIRVSSKILSKRYSKVFKKIYKLLNKIYKIQDKLDYRIHVQKEVINLR